MRRQKPTHGIAARIKEDYMKGKLTLAAVAVAFAMLSVPGTASAGHYRDWGWSKRDHWGWMHRGWDCERKVVKYKKKHHVHKKVKKAKKPAK
jgi:hypothetical protein